MIRSAVIAPIIFILVACSSDDEATPSPPSDCTTSVAALDAGVYPPDAIPKGACTSEGERCQMKIGYACTSGSIGRIDSAQCTCQSGAWSCAVTNGGTSSCPSN